MITHTGVLHYDICNKQHTRKNHGNSMMFIPGNSMMNLYTTMLCIMIICAVFIKRHMRNYDGKQQKMHNI